MKTHMMFRRAFTALACAAALALPLGPAQAQTNETQPPGARLRRPMSPAEAAKLQPGAPVQFDLEIEHNLLMIPGPNSPGGSGPANLDNIVKLLREKHPEANIAMSPELLQVDISDLKLHAASVGEELEALRIASGGKFTWKATQMSPDSMSPLFTLEPSEKFLKESGEPGDSRVEVFNFSSYFARRRDSSMDDAKFQALREQTIRSTKQIVATTVASLHITGPLDFQFHEGANLLVVSGRPEAIGIAGIVVNAMLENSDRGQAERLFQGSLPGSQAQDYAAARGEVEKLQAENMQLKAKLQALEKAASGNKPKPQF